MEVLHTLIERIVLTPDETSPNRLAIELYGDLATIMNLASSTGPTRVDELVTSRLLDWFEHNVIGTVPLRYPGALRRVYPGFLQIAGFMSMNLDRHVNAYVKLFDNLIQGDSESAAATRAFYDEYLTVMDLPAEFYLQTVHEVFQEHSLPRGQLKTQGCPIDPSAIQRTALLTIEGENDDICGVGQTEAAHERVPMLAGRQASPSCAARCRPLRSVQWTPLDG